MFIHLRQIKLYNIYKSIGHKKRRTFLCFSIGSIINYIPFVHKRTDTDENSGKNFNIINEADNLYQTGRYWDVYQLLNNEKSTGIEFYSNGEILWRVVRVLYKISTAQHASKEQRGEVINEAYNLISIAHLNKEDHPEINKWMAIILNCKSELEGKGMLLKNSDLIKTHLLRAHELDPNDYMTLYMIGHWYYSFASLSWFQRHIAKLFYGQVPESNHEEALKYFLKVEELQPRNFIANVYMLGKVNLALRRYFRSKYYFHLAAKMDVRNDMELVYKHEASKFLSLLEYLTVASYYEFSHF